MQDQFVKLQLLDVLGYFRLKSFLKELVALMHS